MTKAKTKYIYRIHQNAVHNHVWQVSKLVSEDLECEAFYNVVEEPGMRRDWICSCPAYKPYCKHIFMVKAYRTYLTKAITKGEPIISGMFDPSDNSWVFTTDQDQDQDQDQNNNQPKETYHDTKIQHNQSTGS